MQNNLLYLSDIVSNLVLLSFIAKRCLPRLLFRGVVLLKILNFFISLIFPRTCSLCGENISFKNNKNICDSCINSLPKLEGLICHKCSLPLSDGGATCTDCKETKNIYFENLKALYVYTDKIRILIKKLKYAKRPFLAKDLSLKMADFIKKENIADNVDIIIPVPIHWYKGLLRGYNQASLLAEGVAKEINKPFYAKALIRTKYTKPQFKLKKQQRIENLENMFVLNKKYADIIKRKNILLIDDIATTCSTANQCSKVLKENKAHKVFVVSLSRASY